MRPGADGNGPAAPALETLLNGLLRAIAEARAGNPDLLSVKEVGGALRCSEDTVRRIPPAALPVYRVGKSNLYFREDVLRYVRSRPVRPRLETSNDFAVADIDVLLREVLNGDAVDVREPAERRAG